MPELAFEAGRMNLTEDQEAQIAQEARDEILGNKKPEEKSDAGDDKGSVKEVEKEVVDDKDKQVESKASDESKVEEVKKEEVTKEQEQQKENDVKRQTLISEYAKRENITPEQATEEVAKNEAVIKKYGDDPIKLAAALRKAQSEFDKTRSDLEKTKQQVQAPKLNDFASVRSYVDKAIASQRDKLVEMYRTEYPGLSGNLDDDAVVDLMRKEATEKMMARVEENRLNESKVAGDKRTQLLNSFHDADKPFLADVKSILDKTPDNIILSDRYDVEDVLRWARGNKTSFEKAVKDADERGYKRGKEEPKIIGEKNPVAPAGKGKSAGTTTDYSAKLTADQRQIAENKFEGMNMSNAEKYKFYFETYIKKG